MLDLKALGQLPLSTRLARNSHPIEAQRVEIGQLIVDDGTLRIGDNGWIEDLPPLPVHIPSAKYPVYAYQWRHGHDTFNVCAAIQIHSHAPDTSRRLRIETDFLPDSPGGIIVDSGEVAIASANTISLSSGLGDGDYPVFANYDRAHQIQSLVVDFKIWQVARYSLSAAQELDEYGMLKNSPEDRARRQAAKERQRQAYLDKQAEADAKITDQRCPVCGKPLPSYRRTCKHCGLRVRPDA